MEERGKITGAKHTTHLFITFYVYIDNILKQILSRQNMFLINTVPYQYNSEKYFLKFYAPTNYFPTKYSPRIFAFKV